MKRKEIKANSVTQSNDAHCHNPRSNGHKNRKAIRRTASKIARQILNKDIKKRIDDEL